MTNPLAKKLFDLTEQETAQLYKNTFETEAGKLVLEDLKQRCWFYQSTFACPYGHEVGEGMRAVCMHIETQLRFEPGQNNEEGVSDA